MRKEVESHIQTCERCQRVKARHQAPYGKFTGWKPELRRWSTFSLDFITGLPLSRKGNNAIQVCIDANSKRIRLMPCNITITAEEAAKDIFENVIKNHGLPRSILSDLDRRYVADIWKAIWKKTGTDLMFTPSYFAISNSVNERSHQVIEDSLRSYITQIEDIEEWDEYISMCEYAMNNHESIDTGYTPFQIDTGQHPLDPISIQHNLLAKDGVLENWQYHARLALSAYIAAQERRLDRINKRRVNPMFKVGDKIMLSSEYLKWAEKTQRGSKLTDRWIGPFAIKRILGKTQRAVELDLSDGIWTFHPIVPVSRCKYYRRDNTTLRIHEEPPESQVIEGEEYFEVQEISARRYNKRSKTYEYRIRFRGFEETESSGYRSKTYLNHVWRCSKSMMPRILRNERMFVS